MSSALKIIGMVLILCGLAWIASDIRQLVHWPASPQVLGFGPGFAGGAQLPAGAIQSAFDTASARMATAATAAKRFRIAADIAAWLAFFATAAVTITLGVFGKGHRGEALPEADHSNSIALPTAVIRWIGGLAALASVLGASGNMTLTYSQRESTRAEALHKAIVNARRDVLDAPNATAAQAVLDELKFQSTAL